ncbi:MFS transporter [Aquabacterium sp.]|uniref:MFS transporter n=1 Tax=Aquabacterium sp. TaxID=1872578 RepID=UPI0037832ABA
MHLDAQPARPDERYLFGPGPAWFAFGMTIALMVFDYVDRQVIVSLFPQMKAEWGLSDRQLGALVSVVSLTVALGALPVALLADRVSRVRSVAVMAGAWSLATVSCMFTRQYGALLAARAVVGVGEAGYGAVGAALIASHFPQRLRGALLAGFFAAASVGSVLGVLLGGLIAARWGWRAAFGVVGLPGLLLALLYLKVRDYQTVALDVTTTRPGAGLRATARALGRSATLRWVCVGGAAQLIVVSALWSWLPSFLNRLHGLAPEQAALKAALVVLAGALGSVLWGALVDRLGRAAPRRKPLLLAGLCVLSMVPLTLAFGVIASASLQFGLVLLGGALATCTVGPASAMVIDVVHPGARATGSSVLALCQNLFGLAAGPLLAGWLSDHWGLQAALAITPGAALLAALAWWRAAAHYERDRRLAQGLAAEADAGTAPERSVSRPKALAA